MVFRPKGGHVYKLRVSDKAGHTAILSTGSPDESIAADVERMVKGFKAQRKWAYLTLLATKRVKLALAYDAFVSGTLDALMHAALVESADIDLQPFVTEWARRAPAKYVAQVRVLMKPGQRFPVSQFTRGRISQFLASLKCADPTRNRYRAALSVFAKWLVEREVLETNPVRDVAMYAERDPRMVWMTWKDAERVAGAAPIPLGHMFALMAGTGMELGAVLRLTAADVTLIREQGKRDRYTIHARGSKTAWRNRVVHVEDWCQHHLAWLIAGRVGAVPLFAPFRHALILAVFRDAQKAVGLSGHRLHDLRHTYAVNALRKGYKPQVVAHQLGHKDATMVTKVYGRFVPDASDYEPKVTSAATSRRKGIK